MSNNNNYYNPNGFTPRTQNQNKRKKKANKDGILTLIFLVLIAIVIIVLVILLVKAINNSRDPQPTGTGATLPIATTVDTSGTTPISTTATDVTTTPTESTTSTTQDPLTPAGFAYAKVNTNTTGIGPLVIVNEKHPYDPTLSDKTLISLYNQEGFKTIYRLRNAHVSLQSSIIEDFVGMIKVMNFRFSSKLGPKDYYLIKYAAAPNDPWLAKDYENENMTGYSFDLRVLLGDLESSNERDLEDDEIAWIKTYGADYGFVLRYDEGKETVTGNEFEPDHIRYVGVPHALYMKDNDLSLEEYVDYIRTYTRYDKPLEYKNGNTTYVIYYFPAGAGYETSVLVPEGLEYTISGDNMGGFIVTAKR